MAKVSIIIPARGESFENLSRTIESIYANATGEFEVLIGYNGTKAWLLPDYPNLSVVEFPNNVGIKTNINALAAMATGKYIYKSDAHCSFGKGFDEILQMNMQDDWVVMPRFYVLDGKTWKWQDERFYDYFYLSCPFTDPRGLRFKAGGHWPERTQERLVSHPDMDETPQIHGSGWMVNRDYYFEVINGFPIKDPMGHGMEPINLALKNWLKGGRVMVNKKTWYAHLHQSSNNRGYAEDKRQTEYTYNQIASHWMANKEPNLIHDMNWFVNEKFPDMPTWVGDWGEKYKEWLKTNN